MGFSIYVFVYGAYIYPGSQLLEDDKPYYKRWWFGNQPITNGGWTSRVYVCIFMCLYSLSILSFCFLTVGICNIYIRVFYEPRFYFPMLTCNF